MIRERLPEKPWRNYLQTMGIRVTALRAAGGTCVRGKDGLPRRSSVVARLARCAEMRSTGVRGHLVPVNSCGVFGLVFGGAAGAAGSKKVGDQED